MHFIALFVRYCNTLLCFLIHSYCKVAAQFLPVVRIISFEVFHVGTGGDVIRGLKCIIVFGYGGHYMVEGGAPPDISIFALKLVAMGGG